MHTHTLSSARAKGSTRSRRSVFGTLRTAFRVMRERGQLAALSEQRLADLGISEAAASREAGRPIWDLPANR